MRKRNSLRAWPAAARRLDGETGAQARLHEACVQLAGSLAQPVRSPPARKSNILTAGQPLAGRLMSNQPRNGRGISSFALRGPAGVVARAGVGFR